MLVEVQLNHHRRGHWSLQWQCPDRNVWRVEHFRTEQDARDFMRFRTGVHEYKIKKNNNAGRYAQIGYWYGN